MEYGILIATGADGVFQILGAVYSQLEALQLADDYIRLGPDNDYLAPERFEIHRRGDRGGYTLIEPLTDGEWLMEGRKAP
jgi:hypothetical protein